MACVLNAKLNKTKTNQMEFEISEHEYYSVIKMSGELIASHQSELLFEKLDRLIEQRKPYFIVELTDLQYLNSSGLSALLHILNLARKAGGETVLLNIPDHLMKLLVITKLHSIFNVATNIEDAIVHFNKPVDTEIS